MRTQAAAFFAATLGLSVAANAAGADPCQLLTMADVKAAIPGDWKQDASAAKHGVCAYEAAGGKSLGLVAKEVAQGAATVLAINFKATGALAKPAPGPGSGAFRAAGKTNNLIQFGKGKYVAHLEANLGATKDPAVLDRLAKAAYDRLP
jgi:hypothetical protein